MARHWAAWPTAWARGGCLGRLWVSGKKKEKRKLWLQVISGIGRCSACWTVIQHLEVILIEWLYFQIIELKNFRICRKIVFNNVCKEFLSLKTSHYMIMRINISTCKGQFDIWLKKKHHWCFGSKSHFPAHSEWEYLLSSAFGWIAGALTPLSLRLVHLDLNTCPGNMQSLRYAACLS